MNTNLKDVTYKEFVEKLKSGHVYTNDRMINADGVLSAALINKVADIEGIERPVIHRVASNLNHSPTVKNLVYGLKASSLDEQREKPATLGQIYSIVGEKVFGSTADAMEKSFIAKIDDCTLNQYDSDFTKMIHNMNPCWNENFSTTDAFDNAVRIAEQSLTERHEILFMENKDDLSGLVNEVERDIYDNREMLTENASIEAASLIKDKMEKAETIVGEERNYDVLHFEQPGVPYKLIKSMSKNTDVVGYTFPSRDGVTYKPLDKDSFLEFSLNVPDRWKDSSEFDVEGMTYCHPAGISMSFTDMDSCMNAVQTMVDEQEGNLEVSENVYEEQDEELAV